MFRKSQIRFDFVWQECLWCFIALTAALVVVPVLPQRLVAGDCNGNRIDDVVDIAAGTSADCGSNGIPDDCEPDGACVSASDLTVLDEDFNDYMIGQDPANWFDTDIFSSDIEFDALFKIKQVGDEVVFGTDSTDVNIHSHYIGPSGSEISTLTYMGRMRITDDDGGVGVTFLSRFNKQSTSEYDYLRLRRSNYAPHARTFHLAPPEFSGLTGDVDSGVDPIVDTWYRFRIEVTETCPQLHIQANVWEDGQPEPPDFQIDAIDPTGVHPKSGTVGVWSMGAGSKYWDDLQVIRRSATDSCVDGEPCDDCDPCTPIDVCVDGTCIGTYGDCDAHAVLPECAEILYVDDSATNGLNTGDSWADAYVDLQDALAEAAINCSVTEVWIAAGTYTPDRGGEQTPGDRDATFRLQNNLALYGGFVGTEVHRDERDPESNETILSGDLLGDDAPVACSQNSPDCDAFGQLCVDGACIISDNNAENARHVVTGTGTNETAILDGFTVSAGNADGSFPDGWGGGMINDSGAPEGTSPTVTHCKFVGNSAMRGGGMWTWGPGPTVDHCTFSRNAASLAGGGMHNVSRALVIDCAFDNNSAALGGGMYNEDSSVTVIQCTFNENYASSGGGGMRNRSGSNSIVDRCTFNRNVATSFGGGLANLSSGAIVTNSQFTGNKVVSGNGGGMSNENASPPSIINCVFSGNHAALNGGGIYGLFFSSQPKAVLNCTLSANVAGVIGGGIYNEGSVITANNCVLWRNSDGNGSGESAQFSGEYLTANYTTIQGGWSGAGVGNIAADPLFADANGADDIVGTEDDDLRLLPGSPAIDAGDNSVVPVDVLTDLDGHARFVDDVSTADTGVGVAPIVDIGAYEFVLGDCDADGDADLADYAILSGCLTGPGTVLGAACACLDLDTDFDVDLLDFSLFQRGFLP